MWAYVQTMSHLKESRKRKVETRHGFLRIHKLKNFRLVKIHYLPLEARKLPRTVQL